MTARPRKDDSVASALVVVLAARPARNYFEIPIETPIQPKLDVSAFQRVLVAGFIAGGTEDVDGNLETTRLLRSQLRTKSGLRVIDADALPLDGGRDASEANGAAERAEPADRRASRAADAIKDEKDLEPYEHLFANVEYWKKIGEEYQQPLIVTGTVLFTPHQRIRHRAARAGSLRLVRPPPGRAGAHLHGAQGLHPAAEVHLHRRPHGATLHSETFREEILYNANQTTPALSSYFELMDRLIPTFLSTLSSQKIKGTRVLLQ